MMDFSLGAPLRVWRWWWCMLFYFAASFDDQAVVNSPVVWRWSNPTPHGNNVIDMANSAAVTVQVCERGQIYFSTDLLTWVPQESHTTNALRAVTFFGERIVITGANGTVLYADAPGDFKLGDLGLGTSDWLEGVVAAPDLSLLVAVGDNGAIYT